RIEVRDVAPQAGIRRRQVIADTQVQAQLRGYLPRILEKKLAVVGPVRSEGAGAYFCVGGELADGRVGEVESGSAGSRIAERELPGLVVGAAGRAADHDLIVV